MLSTQTKRNLLATALLTLVSGCNGQPLSPTDDDEKDKPTAQTAASDTDPAVLPDDHAGGSANVGLKFASSFALTAALDDEAQQETSPSSSPSPSPQPNESPAPGTPVALGDDISLTLAKFNIAAIKLKPIRDPSDEDEQRDREECKEDDQLAETLDPVAAMLKDGGKSDDHPETAEADEKRREHVGAHRDELDAKEHAQAEKEHARDHALRFAGPYVYDALAGTLTGDAPEVVTLPDGSYRRIEFKLKRNMSAAEDDPLLGNVFVIHGTVRRGEELVPFEIEHRHAMKFRLRGDDALAVAPDTDASLVIVFDLGRWFDGVDLAAAKVDDDGVIRVNRKSNAETFRALRRNIKAATRFGKDHDADGKLGSTEIVGNGDATTADDAEEVEASAP